MKRILTILLLLLCVAYMLPVSAMVGKDVIYSIVDIEEDKEDNSKKEKKVEVMVDNRGGNNISTSIKNIYKNTSCILSSLFHTVESPPPDLA